MLVQSLCLNQSWIDYSANRPSVDSHAVATQPSVDSIATQPSVDSIATQSLTSSHVVTTRPTESDIKCEPDVQKQISENISIQLPNVSDHPSIINPNDLYNNDQFSNKLQSDNIDENSLFFMKESQMEPSYLPKFRLKDYGCQKGRDIYCSFKYLAVVYDQMCDCASEFGKEDRFLKCQVANDGDNLGLVELHGDQFRDLLDNINFEFSSLIEIDYSQIALELQKMLHSWCSKISSVNLNTEHIYSTNLENYDTEMITEIINGIQLQNRKLRPEELKKLRFAVMDFQVVFNDLFYYNLRDIGLNLSYCNYLIFQFLQKSYQSCGFYLSNHPISKNNLPFYDGPDVKSAYCHLYLVPLNLSRRYYNYGKDRQTDM